MDIELSAKALGRLIAKAPEYKYYSQASKDVEEDEETKEALQKLKEFEQRIASLQASGEEVTEELKKEYSDFAQEVQVRSKVQALLASQENYLKLMNKVNTNISDGIKEGAQSRIITDF